MTFFQSLQKNILDTLFPVSCLRCGQEGIWICGACVEKMSLVPFQVCPACEKVITESGFICKECARNAPAIDGMVVAVPYIAQNTAHIVSLYKYRFVRDLHIPLGALILRALQAHPLPVPNLIIPVPLHPRRKRWRGFNQSELLASYISTNLSKDSTIPMHSDILLRKRYTPPQMKIKNYSERKENIQQAFSLNNAIAIQGKTILLIDDIATTGSTLSECARVLKQHGAKKVYAAVISRQET